jgi:G2/mitotic-specific cyclin 2
MANTVQNATLTHYAGYSEEEIEPVFKLMIDYLARPVTHEAFFKKYASKRFLKGKRYYIPSCLACTDKLPASILTRKWAKKYAADLGIDVSLPLDMSA